jgi:peroxin-13
MAMVGVAEQFGNLRSYLGSAFNIFGFIRSIRNELYKLVGKRIPVDPNSLSAAEFNQSEARSNQPKYSSRPFWVFISLAVGLPWLMSKLIQRMNERKRLEDAAGRAHLESGAPTSQQQQQLQAAHPSQYDFARALFDFKPELSSELSLSKGQVIAVLEKLDGGWWKGRTQSGEMGYFPANHVEIIDRNRSTTPSSSSLTQSLPGALPPQSQSQEQQRLNAGSPSAQSQQSDSTRIPTPPADDKPAA